jgi:hypothetical protein
VGRTLFGFSHRNSTKFAPLLGCVFIRLLQKSSNLAPVSARRIVRGHHSLGRKLLTAKGRLNEMSVMRYSNWTYSPYLNGSTYLGGNKNAQTIRSQIGCDEPARTAEGCAGTASGYLVIWGGFFSRHHSAFRLQGIVDGIRLTKLKDVAISRHGVSLLWSSRQA